MQVGDVVMVELGDGSMVWVCVAVQVGCTTVGVEVRAGANVLVGSGSSDLISLGADVAVANSVAVADGAGVGARFVEGAQLTPNIKTARRLVQATARDRHNPKALLRLL